MRKDKNISKILKKLNKYNFKIDFYINFQGFLVL